MNRRVCQQIHADSGTFTFFYITADRATLPESIQLLNEAAVGGPISQTPCTGAASTAIVTATVLVDPRGKPTTYRFNGQGFLIQQTDALGQVTTYEREDGTNLLLSVTDPLNRVTRYQYDGTGNVTQITPPVTDPVTPPRTFTYESGFNQVTSATDPLGNTITFEYDGTGNLTAITDPEQNLQPEGSRLKTHLTYNQYGQPLTVTDPLGNPTTFTYNDAGDLVTVTDPLGHTTTRTYDAISRLASQTDPLGRFIWFTYDAMNRPASTGDPLLGVTAFTYDPNGNLLTVQDALGHTTTHEYNNRDRLSRRVDPLGRAETFSYDGNDNLIGTTDRKNQTTTFTYDALNRRTQASYADTTTATFTYDAASRLTQADDTADPHRPVTFTYDPLDDPLTETTTLGTLSYQHDSAGRRTQMTVSGQNPVSYTYDANARLRTITQSPLNPVTLDYDAANRRTSLVLPNGVSTEYQYDLASRLTALIYRNSLSTLGDLQYTYDANGNRITTGGSFARTLVPDAVSTTSYDQANQQLAFADVTQTFDSNGNIATRTDSSGTTTYTWDARNRLTGITGPSLAASFSYDALGRRAVKTINAQDTNFQYDDLDILQESGETGAASYLRTLSIDEALARTDTTGSLFYLPDALGSTVALTDPTGATSATYTFAPFGTTAIAGSPTPNPFQFTGRENDGTGLYYYRARYYDPVRGRFIGEDSVTLPVRLTAFEVLTNGANRVPLLGANLYEYTGGNPIARLDPLGLDWIYSQSTGNLWHLNVANDSMTYVGKGYSGTLTGGRNDPTQQNVKDVGPIPQGEWNIGPQRNTKKRLV